MRTVVDFAQELIDNGFRVWYHPDRPTFLFAAIESEHGWDLGHVELKPSVGYVYSTVNRPIPTWGELLQCAYGRGLSVKVMRKTCRTHAPDWFGRDPTDIKKWKLSQWIKRYSDLIEMT